MPTSLNPTRWTATTPPFGATSPSGQELISLPVEAISTSSKVDLVRSSSILSGNFPQSEPTESMLVPLVNQFGMMQQQMFDQFQQAMAMMIQMFGTMHRDQMEVIRAELDRLHELTEEFHALKNELAERTQEKAQQALRQSELDSAGLGRSAAMEPNSPSPPWPSQSKPEAQGSQVGQAPAPSSRPLTVRTIEQQLSPEPQSLSSQSASSSAASSSISQPTLKTSSQASGKPGTTNSGPDSDRDTVLWLHQRIMVLQRDAREPLAETSQADARHVLEYSPRSISSGPIKRKETSTGHVSQARSVGILGGETDIFPGPINADRWIVPDDRALRLRLVKRGAFVVKHAQSPVTRKPWANPSGI